ncbi:hypothetical protein PoB_002639700 [Plakobranchus ocellatus]|uniref:Uncharacterized protein n=1 Tax=Plakobranchus ocellatus TaxID=259542 RepID=A0AAV3ZZ93_9GAST|nr:hypothetical protein PoB_002639700 [Plakobranchus ocellatus]
MPTLAVMWTDDDDEVEEALKEENDEEDKRRRRTIVDEDDGDDEEVQEEDESDNITFIGMILVVSFWVFSPQQGDPRLLGPPSDQGAGSGA